MEKGSSVSGEPPLSNLLLVVDIGNLTEVAKRVADLHSEINHEIGF